MSNIDTNRRAGVITDMCTCVHKYCIQQWHTVKVCHCMLTELVSHANGDMCQPGRMGNSTLLTITLSQSRVRDPCSTQSAVSRAALQT